MSRQKKDAVSLNVKIESAIMKRFEQYCEELGQTKTKALERILTKHLDSYDKEQEETNGKNRN